MVLHWCLPQERSVEHVWWHSGCALPAINCAHGTSRCEEPQRQATFWLLSQPHGPAWHGLAHWCPQAIQRPHTCLQVAIGSRQDERAAPSASSRVWPQGQVATASTAVAQGAQGPPWHTCWHA